MRHRFDENPLPKQVSLTFTHHREMDGDWPKVAMIELSLDDVRPKYACRLDREYYDFDPADANEKKLHEFIDNYLDKLIEAGVI